MLQQISWAWSMPTFTSLAASGLILFCLLFPSHGHPTSVQADRDEIGLFEHKRSASKGLSSRENSLSFQPHLVLILGDDIGWNDVGWNNPAMHTPFMDSLAADGVILNNYYTFSQCTPSRASILTGIYAHRLGLQRGVLTNEEAYGVPLGFSMLPKHLRKVGYQTHALGKWHIGYCHDLYTPTFRGFDTFLGYYNSAEENFLHCVSDTYVFTNETCNGFDFHNDTLRAPQYYDQYSAEVQTNRAVELINSYDGGMPLFLYVSITGMHFPVQARPEDIAKCNKIMNKARTTFCGAMAALDESVENITNALKANDMWEKTVLVFASDNGASVSFGGSNYPLRGEKVTQWEGGSRVPAFVNSPLLKKRNYVNNQLIHVTDWYPTFLRLAGAKNVKGIDGVDQWSTISEDKASGRKDVPYLFDQINGTIIAAIRDPTYKLIVGPGGEKNKIYPEKDIVDSSFNLTLLRKYLDYFDLPFNLSDKRIRLFDLENDPSESNDISDQHPQIVRRMLQRLQEYQKDVKPAVKLHDDTAGKPSNFGGWYMPGWCSAHIFVPDIPIEPVNYMNLFNEYSVNNSMNYRA